MTHFADPRCRVLSILRKAMGCCTVRRHVHLGFNATFLWKRMSRCTSCKQNGYVNHDYSLSIRGWVVPHSRLVLCMLTPLSAEMSLGHESYSPSVQGINWLSKVDKCPRLGERMVSCSRKSSLERRRQQRLPQIRSCVSKSL